MPNLNFQYTIYDIESYWNYALIVAEHRESDGDKIRISTRMSRADQISAFKNFKDRIMVGYNSSHYDSLILEMWYTMLLEGRDNSDIERALKEASNMIIQENAFKYEVFKKFGVEYGDYFHHLDLAQGYLSIGTLKEVGIRLHHDILEHTPVDFQSEVQDDEIDDVVFYCDNDVDITKLMFERKFNEVEAKEVLIRIFDLDWTAFSKTNRVIVEEILCGKSRSKGSDVCVYREPKFRETGEQYHFNFKNEELQQLLEFYTANVIPDGAKISKIVNVDDLEYEFRLGGLHASKQKYVKPDDKDIIIADFASYYPFLMKNFGFIPPSVKKPEDFFKMIDDRIIDKQVASLAYKHNDMERNKLYSDLAWAKKIVINTVYGAAKMRNAKLYDVQTAYSITITGQLLLMKLCENLSINGYTVIYANTDGIMFEADKGDKGWEPICHDFEEETQLSLEFDNVRELFLRDVNNYMMDIGTVEKPKLKSVGVYNLSALNKNEGHQRIVKTAVYEYLFNEVPIEQTVRNCQEITEFTMYQKYSRQYDPVVIEDLDGNREKVANVVRYVYSKDNYNFLKGMNTNADKESWTIRDRNILSVPDLKELTIDQIDKERYIEDSYSELAKMLGEKVFETGNKELDKLREYALELGLPEEGLKPGIGKKRLSSKYKLDPWLDIRNDSVQIEAGPESGILVLDIDDPSAQKAKDLLSYLTSTGIENYAISYSSEYEFDDILANKARFKVLFKYQGKRIPNKKANKAIELFYNNSPVAILGERGDGFRYLIEGELNEINFDVNDYLEAEVKFQFMEREKTRKKPKT